METSLIFFSLGMRLFSLAEAFFPHAKKVVADHALCCCSDGRTLPYMETATWRRSAKVGDAKVLISLLVLFLKVNDSKNLFVELLKLLF